MDNLEYRDFPGKDIAIQAANNYRKLRKYGITVNVIIVTFCIENGFPLIHNDRDLKNLKTTMH